jgi:transcriptional regulator with XRE-family HTH domain
MIKNKDLNKQYSLFSNNIKAIRLQLNLTQEQLAERSDISISYIKQIESGKDYKNISLTVLLKLSKALDTSIANLFLENKKNLMKK